MSFFEGVVNPLDVIVVNRQFSKQLNEEYGLDHPDILQKTIDEFNSYNKLADDKEKAIKKASCLNGGFGF